MTPTVATSSNSVTTARCRPIPKSSPICSTCSFAATVSLRKWPRISWPLLRGTPLTACRPSKLNSKRRARVYSDALVNGPFSVILGSEEGLLALNDRLKLRALMVGEKDSMVYLASEQASIELVCPDVENVRSIEGGVPFVVQLDEVARAKQNAAAENEPDIHQQTRITRKEA